MAQIQIRSCGFLVFRNTPESGREFLLMRHPKRWDLPKGHVDPGETQMQCALRELWEETGIQENQIQVDPEFVFKQQYTVRYKRNGNQPQLKELVIFLATLQEEVKIQCTEHASHEWWKWKPPHEIQAETIDPLLQQLAEWEKR